MTADRRRRILRAVRVLVVDDDDSTRGVLVEALADEGYVVMPAADGAAALALLEAWRPDLILLDLLMPGMDGWAFTEAYQQIAPPHAPLVLLTAGTVGLEETVAGRPVPAAAGVLPKPFILDDLLALVQRHAQSAPHPA